MELKPGTYFEMHGKPYTFVGVQSDASDDRQRIVARVNPDDPYSNNLHTILDPKEVAKDAVNFWSFQEALSYTEFVRQYNEQLHILDEMGVVRELTTGEKGIQGINGVEYPIPSLEAIRLQMQERVDDLKPQFTKDFNQLLLVPFGISVMDALGGYRNVIRNHFVPSDEPEDETYRELGKKMQFFNREKTKLLTRDEITGKTYPYFLNKNALIVTDLDIQGQYEQQIGIGYFPDKDEEGRSRMATKTGILEGRVKDADGNEYTAFPGWFVEFVQDVPTVPINDTYPDEHHFLISTRVDYFEFESEVIKHRPVHYFERAMTLDEWVMFAATMLSTKDCVVDDDTVAGIKGRTPSETVLLGNKQMFIQSNVFAKWNGENAQVQINSKQSFGAYAVARTVVPI